MVVNVLRCRLGEQWLWLALRILWLLVGLSGCWHLAVQGRQLKGATTPVWVVRCRVNIVLDCEAGGRQVART